MSDTSKKQTKAKLSPMMERYQEVKAQNPGSLLLFRMGDFYELFYHDAEVAAKILGLTLTSRDKNSANPIPMAGFPYHSLEQYLNKLIQAGFRAAICEQVEDPKLAKGLVRREVTRIVTPGTLTDDSLLNPRSSNFLACVYPGKGEIGLAWLELSTGQFFTTQLMQHELVDELSRISPAECLFPEAAADDFHDANGLLDQATISLRPDWSFSQRHSQAILLKHFGTKTLEGFDLPAEGVEIIAAGALLEYVQETQKSSLDHIHQIAHYQSGDRLLIDHSTRRSLELTQTLRQGERHGSLLEILDQTATSMGARLLADWLASPLTEISAINHRLDAIEELTTETVLRSDLHDLLDQTYDLARLTGRISTRRASPRDLGSLAKTLSVLPKMKARLTGRNSALLQQLEQQLDLCAEMRAEIDALLVDAPPLTTTDGGIIRTGYDARLDELHELARGGKEWITRYQAREAERVGIPNLKIGFNKVFGYYLEVTAANRDKVPEEYIRKQTLKNQERYITPELKEHEEKVLSAEEQAFALEQQLFESLRERVAQLAERLLGTAEVLAQVDVLNSLARLAVSAGYCRPELTEEPILDIREGRHPVLQRLQPSGTFVPNDVRLNPQLGFVQIITGPNMAGKSTYIRQTALLVIMAQMGSFVPASEARIGISDRIFARVGASDELGKGQSTFMVEMTETARILNAATEKSLVILDEIGRGTSTYDGISLAWAVTEYLHDQIHARTLFATHYHELTELSEKLSGVSNWNVLVQEAHGEICFLHRIVEGAADQSYGIHVAKLAGVPNSVIKRAQSILNSLEADDIKVPERNQNDRQLSLFNTEPHPLLNDIRKLKLEEMTPLAALQELHRLQTELD